MSDKVKAEFEAFASSCGLNTAIDDDFYKSQIVGWMWRAWIAAKGRHEPSTKQQEAEPVAWVSEGALKRLSDNQIVAAMGSEHDGVKIPLYLHPPMPAAQSQVPEGYQLVPVQLIEFIEAKEFHLPVEDRHVLSVMLSAAKEEGKDV